VRPLVFAANWKMNLGPDDARAYFAAFRSRYSRLPDRDVWFFPPSVSLETAAGCAREIGDLTVGVQDIYWEPKGAFTGAVSAPLAAQAGARAALVGHSERRHVFGETDDDTRKKVAAAFAAGLTPMLCVGELLSEREDGATLDVVHRQLEGALVSLEPSALDQLLIAYEPVWAIGTGRNATPRDAALVHHAIRAWLKGQGATRARILYGGSVNLKNIAELLAEPELDGVLVGGASLDPQAWAQLVQTQAT